MKFGWWCAVPSIIETEMETISNFMTIIAECVIPKGSHTVLFIASLCVYKFFECLNLEPEIPGVTASFSVLYCGQKCHRNCSLAPLTSFAPVLFWGQNMLLIIVQWSS